MKILSTIKQQFNKRKIKIVAIAKDEAPYLAHWIFHHLHFGFDAISVHINRTSDKSREVIDIIARQHPNVDWQDADWVDYLGDHVRSHLQSIIYAKAYQDAFNEGYTHVFFIDIDEFWCPSNFKTSIHSFLDEFDSGASVSFQWFCELGKGIRPFEIFNQSLYGYSTNQVKTLINLQNGIRRVGIHIPIFEDGSKHYFADKTRFKRAHEQNQQSAPEFRGLKNSFLIHRLFRSELEYVVALSRGNPEKVDSWKDNRGGYSASHPDEELILFPQDSYQEYTERYLRWLKETKLAKTLESAKDKVKSNFIATLDILEGTEGAKLKALPALNGVNLAQLSKELKPNK